MSIVSMGRPIHSLPGVNLLWESRDIMLISIVTLQHEVEI